jgi:hypothetical protein
MLVVVVVLTAHLEELVAAVLAVHQVLAQMEQPTQAVAVVVAVLMAVLYPAMVVLEALELLLWPTLAQLEVLVELSPLLAVTPITHLHQVALTPHKEQKWHILQK